MDGRGKNNPTFGRRRVTTKMVPPVSGWMADGERKGVKRERVNRGKKEANLRRTEIASCNSVHYRPEINFGRNQYRLSLCTHAH